MANGLTITAPKGDKPLANPADIGFVQAAAAVTRPAPALTTGFDEAVVGETDLDDVGVFDSIGAALADSGGIVGLVRSNINPVRGEPDPDYNLQAHMEAGDPEDLKLLTLMLKDPDNTIYGSTLSRLADSQSGSETTGIFRQYREAKLRQEEALANGWLPLVIGTGAGIGIDVAAALVLAGTTGIGALPSAATRTGLAARSLAAARLAGLASAEAAGERAAQGISNPMIGGEDIMTAAGIGLGAGAALGFLFPTLLGNVRRIREGLEPRHATEAGLDEARRMSAHGGTSGAARSPGVDTNVNVPARASGSLLARFLPKALQEKLLRNPKRVIVDIGVDGNTEFVEKGLEGGRKFFDVMSRAVRVSTAMADEVGGGVARAQGVTDVLDEFRAHRIAREKDVKRLYQNMMEEVYGAGPVVVAIRNNQFKQGKRHLMGQDDFEALADEIAAAKRNGTRLEELIPEQFTADLTAEQRSIILKRAEEHSVGEDAYYKDWGTMEKEHGLIPDDVDLDDGYRPQRWNREQIGTDPEGFELFMLNVFHKNPDDVWLREQYSELLGADGGFRELQKLDPVLAREALDDWGAAVKQFAEEKAFKLSDDADTASRVIADEKGSEIAARVGNKIRQERNLWVKLDRKLDETPTGAARVKLSTRLAKVERRIAEEENKLFNLRAASRSKEGLRKFIAKFGNQKQGRLVKKAEAAAQRAARKSAVATARKTLNEQMSGIREAILNGDSPFQFIDPKFVNSSSRFKRRSIHLGKHRHTPEARRFLLTNTSEARGGFDSSVGTQIALREIYGEAGGDLGNSLRKQALQGYEDDLRKVTDAGERAAIAKASNRAGAIFDHIFKELTKADVTQLRGLNRDAHNLVNMLNTATAAMSLGGVVLSQIGDLAVQIMAGGRLGTGFRVMWRGNVRKHLREISQSEGDLAVFLHGLSIEDGSRWRNYADIDFAGFDVPGGKFSTLQRVVNETARLEGWANLMHIWNSIVRGGFGLDFARQLDLDMAKYASLSPSLKTFYTRIGIDEKTAADMTELLNRSNRKFINGHLRIPNSAEWASTRPDLLRKYKVAIKTAGDEAMIDPGVGDRPFLRSMPYGRIVLQFQSFMFTAGERFMAPLIQEMGLHPTSVRPYFAALAGVFLGIATDGSKAAVRGEFGEWYDRWDEEDGWVENLWGGVMRSPMMVGPSSMITEVLTSTFGRVMNDHVENTTGFRPFRQQAVRFRENQGLIPIIAGPAGGLFGGTLINIGKNVADGEFEKAGAQLSRRLPLANIFYLQILARLAQDN